MLGVGTKNTISRGIFSCAIIGGIRTLSYIIALARYCERECGFSTVSVNYKTAFATKSTEVYFGHFIVYRIHLFGLFTRSIFYFLPLLSSHCYLPNWQIYV